MEENVLHVYSVQIHGVSETTRLNVTAHDPDRFSHYTQQQHELYRQPEAAIEAALALLGKIRDRGVLKGYKSDGWTIENKNPCLKAIYSQETADALASLEIHGFVEIQLRRCYSRDTIVIRVDRRPVI